MPDGSEGGYLGTRMLVSCPGGEVRHGTHERVSVSDERQRVALPVGTAISPIGVLKHEGSALKREVSGISVWVFHAGLLMMPAEPNGRRPIRRDGRDRDRAAPRDPSVDP